MAEPLDLLTSVDDFHDMHLLADKARRSVKIDAQKLKNLLIDHTCMMNALQSCAIKVRGPAPIRRREHILE